MHSPLIRRGNRRMPSGTDPQAARPHEDGAVELQGDDSGPALRGAALNHCAILDPEEMLLPALVAWVKQPHDLARQRIVCRKPVALVAVTERAGKPEVIFLSHPTERLGDDVLNFHRGADQGLLGEAVTAAMTCLGGDTLAKRLGNVGFPHDGATMLETSWPRAFSNATAWARTSIDRSYSCKSSLLSSCSDGVSPARWRLRLSASRRSLAS